MPTKIILTGDINLMNVTDATVPFRLIAKEFHATDLVFSNFECCLYEPPHGSAVDAENKNEGFFVDPDIGGQALKLGGIQAVGIANNVNYGDAAILSSVAALDKLDILHTGAGKNRQEACAPVIVERNGLRIGILQRTSVYWPANHEAIGNMAGVAVIKGHTAYHVPMHKTRSDVPPLNRPGIPPFIITWTDAEYLQRFKQDIAALREQTDFVVASCHWGLHRDVLQYMPEIAHAAIDAGADVVMGHGPHFSLPVEAYKGKPVFYGLGGFSFHTGHGAIKHGNWVGMMPRIVVEGKTIQSATFQFVRHNDDNETFLCSLKDEAEILADITHRSKPYGVKLTPQGDQVAIDLK